MIHNVILIIQSHPVAFLPFLGGISLKGELICTNHNLDKHRESVSYFEKNKNKMRRLSKLIKIGSHSLFIIQVLFLFGTVDGVVQISFEELGDSSCEATEVNICVL